MYAFPHPYIIADYTHDRRRFHIPCSGLIVSRMVSIPAIASVIIPVRPGGLHPAAIFLPGICTFFYPAALSNRQRSICRKLCLPCLVEAPGHLERGTSIGVILPVPCSIVRDARRCLAGIGKAILVHIHVNYNFRNRVLRPIQIIRISVCPEFLFIGAIVRRLAFRQVNAEILVSGRPRLNRIPHPVIRQDLIFRPILPGNFYPVKITACIRIYFQVIRIKNVRRNVNAHIYRSCSIQGLQAHPSCIIVLLPVIIPVVRRRYRQVRPYVQVLPEIYAKGSQSFIAKLQLGVIIPVRTAACIIDPDVFQCVGFCRKLADVPIIVKRRYHRIEIHLAHIDGSIVICADTVSVLPQPVQIVFTMDIHRICRAYR